MNSFINKFRRAVHSDIIDEVKDYTFCSEDKLRSLITQANRINSLGYRGDFVECGTYKGGTAAILSRFMGEGRTLWLYDSFDGMPVTTEKDGEAAKEYIGKGATDVREDLNFYTIFNIRIVLHQDILHRFFDKATLVEGGS